MYALPSFSPDITRGRFFPGGGLWGYRWGGVVYRNGDGPVARDGTFSGNRCTDGTYYYVLEVKGPPIKQKGFIRLAR